MRTVGLAICMLFVLAVPGAAISQDKYPSKSVRIIVPFSAGSGTDIIARVFADHMTRVTGQGFVVDNRQGADGIIGTEAIARATPDGYTWVCIGTIQSCGDFVFGVATGGAIASFCQLALCEA